MLSADQFLTLAMDSEAAVVLITERLKKVDLQIMQSFDLRAASAAHGACICPYHGSDQCDCQMVVYLVYGQIERPVTIVLHSHNQQTYLSLVDRQETGLGSKIIAALT